VEGVTYTPAIIGMLVFLGLISLVVIVYVFVQGFQAGCDYFFPTPEVEDPKDDGCACPAANKRAEDARRVKDTSKT
jgi:hypothetical protein